MPAGSSIPGWVAAAACAIVAALAAPARANDHDVVFATGQTQLHKRPGEAAPVVGHADEGDELEVLGDQGRWLRVRNGKQIGWVTRTEVASSKPAEPRRSARSGFSGRPVQDAVKVTIAIDRVRGFDDPRSKARAVLDLARGDVVTMLGRGYQGWILVEPEAGGTGWIPEAAVADAGAFKRDPRAAPAEVARPAAAPVAAAPAATTQVVAADPRTLASRLRGSLLVTAGAQTFQMRQSGEADGTAIATGELARIAGGGQLRVRGELWVGLGATAQLGKAELTYYGATDTSAAMPTRELAIDAYAEAGLGRMPYVALRGGVHYARFSVTSDRAEAMLIGERIAGATVGLGGALGLGHGLALSAAADAMPAGAQKLAKLPAGTLYATTVKAAWGRGTLSYALPAHLQAAVSYRFGIQSAQLTDGGMAPKTASRTDLSHEVTAGVGLAW